MYLDTLDTLIDLARCLAWPAATLLIVWLVARTVVALIYRPRS